MSSGDYSLRRWTAGFGLALLAFTGALLADFFLETGVVTHFPAFGRLPNGWFLILWTIAALGYLTCLWIPDCRRRQPASIPRFIGRIIFTILLGLFGWGIWFLFLLSAAPWAGPGPSTTDALRQIATSNHRNETSGSAHAPLPVVDGRLTCGWS